MTENTFPVVIIGSGLAAWTVARELRKLDKQRAITLVSRDNGDFYSKPMLSNALASGKTADQLINTPRHAIAAQLNVTVLSGAEVQSIQRTDKALETDAGPLPYSQLVIATGADPIQVPLAGGAAQDVLSVNDLHDYAQFRSRIAGRQRVAIMGAGLIGCEFANDLMLGGYQVDLIDPGAQALGRLLTAPAAEQLQHAMQAAGVRFHLGTSVQAANHAADGLRLTLASGQTLETDVLLSAIGLRPRVALARAAGLAVNRGVVVDDQLRSNDRDIFALGDVAEIDGQVLPFVMPLMQAARVTAAQLAGQDTRLTLPVMPVVVKTPVCPVVAVSPVSTQGQWKHEVVEGGLVSRFESTQGQLLGFSLTGKATGRKNSLLTELAAQV